MSAAQHSIPSVSHVLYLSAARGQNPFSGAENHVITLVRELSAAGADVELIVLVWEDSDLIRQRLAELKAFGVRVTEIARAAHSSGGARLRRAIGVYVRLRQLLAKRRGRVIHLHLDLLALPVCARSAGCRNIVVSVHNDEQYYRRLAWRIWLRVVDFWVREYIAITNHVARHYAECVGLGSGRLSVVYYGVPECADPPASRAELGVSSGAFVVGFIGRLTAQKDVPTLLRAVGQSEGVEAVIIGDGELRPMLEALAQQVAPGRIHFLGPRSAAARYMWAFDAFCLPSRWEGLGLVLIEAMQAGRPIVASRAGAIPEVLDHGQYGSLCDQGDVEAFAREFARLRDLPPPRRADASALRGHASSVFSIPEMVRRTLDVYRQVLA